MSRWGRLYVGWDTGYNFQKVRCLGAGTEQQELWAFDEAAGLYQALSSYQTIYLNLRVHGNMNC